MFDQIYAYHGDPQAAATGQVGQQHRVLRKGASAIIHIQGSLSRDGERGTSTELAAQLILQAAADDSVDRIVLRVNSPGGRVAGTSDLVDAIVQARGRKPIIAYIEDVGASAAFWIASQANEIWAGRTSIVGSIGTYSVLLDASKAFDQMGLRVVKIGTGQHKGVGAIGTSISEEQQAELQRVVDSLNEQFLQGVSEGRHMSIDKVRELADGRVWTAPEALGLGLIDHIGSFDAALGSTGAPGNDYQSTERFDLWQETKAHLAKQRRQEVDDPVDRAEMLASAIQQNQSCSRDEALQQVFRADDDLRMKYVRASNEQRKKRERRDLAEASTARIARN